VARHLAVDARGRQGEIAKSWSLRGEALLLGFLLAIIALAIAVLAYSTGCRLTLFGFTIDPFDELVLLVIGLICGCGALLKIDEMLKAIDQLFTKMKLARAAALFSISLVALLVCPGAQAEAKRLPLVGLSACPDGDVIGFDLDGTVIEFAGTPRGAWRHAGRIDRSFKPGEITCADMAGKKTAFVVAMAVNYIYVVDDLSSLRATEEPNEPLYWSFCECPENERRLTLCQPVLYSPVLFRLSRMSRASDFQR
jgi:hypothetical protein